ncbi:MAG TPA: hypothetical protein VIN03_29195 [Roseateles sp.]
MTQFRPSQLASAEALHAAPAPQPDAPQFASETPLADALHAEAEPTHLLHFEPLSAQSAGLDIPCDPQGRVGLDALGDKLRNDYFFARALIGRLFARPTVRQALPLMHA